MLEKWFLSRSTSSTSFFFRLNDFLSSFLSLLFTIFVSVRVCTFVTDSKVHMEKCKCLVFLCSIEWRNDNLINWTGSSSNGTWLSFGKLRFCLLAWRELVCKWNENCVVEDFGKRFNYDDDRETDGRKKEEKWETDWEFKAKKTVPASSQAKTKQKTAK